MFTKNHLPFSTWVISIGSIEGRIFPWPVLFIYWTCHRDWIWLDVHSKCMIRRPIPPSMCILSFRFRPSSTSNTFLFVDLKLLLLTTLFQVVFFHTFIRFIDLWIKMIMNRIFIQLNRRFIRYYNQNKSKNLGFCIAPEVKKEMEVK